MRKLLIAVLFLLGAFFGLVWWFDVEEAGGSFSDFFADPVGGTQSLFSRLQLKVAAMVENLKGASGAAQANPRTLAASLVAGFEGFSAKAYPDPEGQTAKHSIGYGHQLVPGDGFTLESVISEGDALAQLQADLDVFAACVDNAVTVPLGPNETAALYSFAYNEGCGAFKASKLLRLLNAGDYVGADAEFARWNVANGSILPALVSRRASEAAEFAKDIASEDATNA
jgi:lysozyme